MDIPVIDIPAVRVAYLRYKGPFGPAVGEFWKEVFTPWQQAFGLQGRTTYGVARDDPATTAPAECRYDACVEVDAGYTVAEPAKEGTVGGGRHAVAAFKGRGDQIPGAWGEFLAAVHAQGLRPRGPCFERYPADYAMDPATGVFEAELCVAVE